MKSLKKLYDSLGYLKGSGEDRPGFGSFKTRLSKSKCIISLRKIQQPHTNLKVYFVVKNGVKR
jgi:hypothetical protein